MPRPSLRGLRACRPGLYESASPGPLPLLLLLLLPAVVLLPAAGQPAKQQACAGKADGDACSFTYGGGPQQGQTGNGTCSGGTCDTGTGGGNTGGGNTARVTCPALGETAFAGSADYINAGPNVTGKAAPLRGSIGCVDQGPLATRPKGRAGPNVLDATNIYGPMEAGFSKDQPGASCLAAGNGLADFVLPGGVDTNLAEAVMVKACDDRGLGSMGALLDYCGGHANPFHYHERMNCLYSSDPTTGHSTRIGTALDGNGIYGHNIAGGCEPTDLDWCGGRTGVTPDSNGQEVYYYVVSNKAPFALACFGPVDTEADCRALYPECDGVAQSFTTAHGTDDYDLDCPCFDPATGSNMPASSGQGKPAFLGPNGYDAFELDLMDGATACTNTDGSTRSCTQAEKDAAAALYSSQQCVDSPSPSSDDGGGGGGISPSPASQGDVSPSPDDDGGGGGGSSTSPSPASQVVQACYTGYVMDVFCIERGTLLDNGALQTLDAGSPAAHTLHCLVDPSVCYAGYEVLRDVDAGQAQHCRAFKLDAAGNAAVLALARQTGSSSGCSTCTGDASTGQRKGFRATFKGTIDLGSSARPRVFTTTSVLPASDGCGDTPEIVLDASCDSGDVSPSPDGDADGEGGDTNGGGGGATMSSLDTDSATPATAGSRLLTLAAVTMATAMLSPPRHAHHLAFTLLLFLLVLRMSVAHAAPDARAGSPQEAAPARHHYHSNPPPYSTNFASRSAVLSDWTLDDACEHCGHEAAMVAAAAAASGGRDECTHMTPDATTFGEVLDGTGMRHTTRRLPERLPCGASVASGHLTWQPNILYGNFTITARFFPGGERNVSSATGFIGLDAAGNKASITMGFHGDGWFNEGEGAHKYQHGIYADVKKTHNREYTTTKASLADSFNTFGLLWTAERVEWRFNGKVVRTVDDPNIIPSLPMQMRLHSRSGDARSLSPNATFVAEFLSFQYAPM